MSENITIMQRQFLQLLQRPFGVLYKDLPMRIRHNFNLTLWAYNIDAIELAYRQVETSGSVTFETLCAPKIFHHWLLSKLQDELNPKIDRTEYGDTRLCVRLTERGRALISCE